VIQLRFGCFVLLALWMIAMLATLGCSSCRRPSNDDGTTPMATDLPKLELRDDSPDLLITWVDAKGDFHTVQRPADVPIEGRDIVRVVVVGKQQGTGDLFYAADLRSKAADGTYPVNTMTRAEWESLGERRRAITMAAAAPSAGSAEAASGVPSGVPTATASAVGALSRLTVTVYGAAWCEPCHEAQRYLRRKGISVVYKDIDEDESAKREMAQKLRRAGLSDQSSIPVIDVRGRILLGFSAREIDKAIAQVTRGDTL
jgi:glutaredoxin